jgi:ABC-type dipeptide/oligopeptide/nickel transport system permease component
LGLLNFIIRRLLMMVVILFGVTIVVFSIMMMLPPGQRVSVYVQNERISAAQMETLIDKYGLNDPAPVQYIRWIKNVAKGDFGFSITAASSVVDGFKQYFPVTLELVLLSGPLIILVGILLGSAAAVNKDKPIDHFTRIFSIVGYSLPTFWLGLILLMIFYGYFGLFEPGILSNEYRDVFFSDEFRSFTGLLVIDGILNNRWDVAADAFMHLILPTINLVILSSALIMRLMRSSMLESLGQDYIRTALAKGASKKVIIAKHARRNAMIPVITVSGLMMAGLMAGMVITETIFSRPGIGRWMAQAALRLDVPAIMFNVLFLSIIFIVTNLVVDIIYAYIDPRIRLS